MSPSLIDYLKYHHHFPTSFTLLYLDGYEATIKDILKFTYPIIQEDKQKALMDVKIVVISAKMGGFIKIKSNKYINFFYCNFTLIFLLLHQVLFLLGIDYGLELLSACKYRFVLYIWVFTCINFNVYLLPSIQVFLLIWGCGAGYPAGFFIRKACRSFMPLGSEGFQRPYFKI